MCQNINAIIEDFNYITDWQDRYQYIIELGSNLPSYPEEKKTDEYKVTGCISQVWLDSSKNGQDENATFTFIADSDSHMVKGLLAIVLAIYNGRTQSEIKNIDVKNIFNQLKLTENITPQRSNGVLSVIKKIEQIANN